ncbi:proline--tRNA ligase [Candidatus Bathyarchaeota archaeon]|nr:MAG: proline--tRNA ligase [Candidatus Bathyarchaeota archaeon]
MQKDENFSEWYDRVLLEAQIVDDRYPVKGFSVYLGWGFSIAKRIVQMLEERLEEEGHQPMQFPVVIPEDAFQKEAEHIAGFAGEVFWITHAGENRLERRLLLRPTSETAIYPLFKIWIRSHADLPLRMHQTCNVYRYETKATRPLYRGREFLWNEAHTAHVDYEGAERQVRKGVEIYRSVYDRLGLSYLLLKRPDFDKFAGAVYSLAFDTWNPDGKVNQIGTVHELGENFARAFDVTYEDEKGVQRHVSTTCYGMGIGRTLAATIAHHGDDHGLVLPPVVAPKQVVIVPIPFKGSEEAVAAYSREIEARLSGAGVRVVLDDDDRLRPGEKFYKWEMFGVPVRIEVGPREVEERSATLVRRDTLERSKAELDGLIDAVRRLFDDIYRSLRERSWRRLEEEIAEADSLDQLRAYMEERRIVKVNWCGDPDCAFKLKDEVAGEVRGTLWERREEPTGPCIVCGDAAKEVAYVSRTY